MRAAIFVLLILWFIPFLASADDEWSPVQSGLQARLFISRHPQTADWTYDVMIEFRNVFENSAGLGAEMTVRYFKPILLVTDSAGRKLPMTAVEGSETIGTSDLVLPPRGRLVFPIGSGGGSATATSGPSRMLRFGQLTEWMIPVTGGPYRLSAIFSTEPQPQIATPGFKVVVRAPVDVPRERPYAGWRGTLHLPAMELPQN